MRLEVHVKEANAERLIMQYRCGTISYASLLIPSRGSPDCCDWLRCCDFHSQMRVVSFSNNLDGIHPKLWNLSKSPKSGCQIMDSSQIRSLVTRHESFSEYLRVFVRSLWRIRRICLSAFAWYSACTCIPITYSRVSSHCFIILKKLEAMFITVSTSWRPTMINMSGRSLAK